MPKPLVVHWSLWNQNRVPTETFEGFHKSVVPEHARFVPMTESIPYYYISHNFFFLSAYVQSTLRTEMVNIKEDDSGSPLRSSRR